MAKRRRFTPQFKAEVVIEALMGQSYQPQCRLTVEVETPVG